MTRHLLGSGLALVTAVALMACDDNGPGGGADVSVSFAGAPATSASVIAGDPLTDGIHTLNIQAIDIAFDEIVLERSENETGGDSDGDSDLDSDSDGSANEEVRGGPVTVSLPLQGGVITPIVAAVPTGRFEELEMDATTARVRGTYDGQQFDVTFRVDHELEFDFNPPFEVKDGPGDLNITVRIDSGNWFRGSNGSLIDPRALAANESLRSEVRNRVRASFRAFEDSDKDADDADSDSDAR